MKKKKSINRTEVLNSITKATKQNNDIGNIKQADNTWLTLVKPQICPKIRIYCVLIGDSIIGTSLVMASYLHINYLLISIFGFVMNWLSFSIDKKLDENSDINKETSRNLIFDISINCISILFITIGFMIYVGSPFRIFGLILIILYACRVIISLLYKNEADTSSSEIINSSQLKLLIIIMIIAEFFIPSSILYSAIFIISLLIVTNIIQFKNQKSIDRNF